MHDDAQTLVEPFNGLRYVTLLFYLNPVDAGETHFPNQKVKVKPPKEGLAVVFSAMLTHPHEVLATPVDRFIFQTWITDPELLVTYRG